MVKKLEDWQTYRTRFLVSAKQLASPLKFSDNLGREHCGIAGDYLVESSDGIFRIAPRQLFEDIYVPVERDLLRDSNGEPETDQIFPVHHAKALAS